MTSKLTQKVNERFHGKCTDIRHMKREIDALANDLRKKKADTEISAEFLDDRKLAVRISLKGRVEYGIDIFEDNGWGFSLTHLLEGKMKLEKRCINGADNETALNSIADAIVERMSMATTAQKLSKTRALG